MRYVGGKHSIARWLASHILPLAKGYRRYVEPFIGGANSFVALAPHFESIEGYDAHPDLILLLKAIGEGWEPPDAVSFEAYQELRGSEPSPLRGFAGFAASYGGAWFSSYGALAIDQRSGRLNDFPGETKRALLKHRRTLARATLGNQDYKDLIVTPGTVIYCDPPYGGTMGYRGVNKLFSIVEFWKVAEAWNEQGALVFVSEGNAPSHWTVLAEKEVGHRLRDGGAQENKRRVERLYWLG